MNNQKDPRLNREDDLRAENNLLKIKLDLEHNMQLHTDDSAALPPDIENQWLKSVYAFEQQFKDAKRIKLYDRIGRPAFKKWHTLSSKEAASELERLQSIMKGNGVEFDCICQYDDGLIYRFVTEELFEHEMDDIRLPGMATHLIYEEFHPNHDYDLRRQANDFVDGLFKRKWSEEFDGLHLARTVLFAEKEYAREQISAFISAFQEVHSSLQVQRFHIVEVAIDLVTSQADVSAMLAVTGDMKPGDRVRYDGICSIHFAQENDYWYIRGFRIPGLNAKRYST